MSINKEEYIAELNQNYHDLGEDMLMLEAVLLAPEGETGFSRGDPPWAAIGGLRLLMPAQRALHA